MKDFVEVLREAAGGRREVPKTKLEQNRMAARRRILTAWRELHVDGDGTQTSINELVKKAEVSKGTFYAIFADRDELTTETAFECLREMLDGIRGPTDFVYGDSMEERTRASIDFIVDLAERYRWEILFILRLLSADTPESSAFKKKWIEFWDEYLQTSLTNDYELAGMDIPFNLRVVSRAFYSIVTDLVEWWLTDPDPVPREVLVDSVVHVMVLGSMPR
jgi:AcrR family transcriptional regulator